MTKLPPELTEYFRSIGSKGGKNSGKNMTPEQKKERAKNAALTRWKKKKENNTEKTEDTP